MDNRTFCSIVFSDFFDDDVYGYACIAMCLMGSVANILNIIVFSQKNMISPTNFLLNALAIVNLALLLQFMPIVWYLYMDKSGRSYKDLHTYSWILTWHWYYDLVYEGLRATAVWFTVLLGVWRYIAIVYPHKSRRLCNMKATLIGIIGGCIVSPLLCMPLMFTTEIRPFVQVLDDDGQPTTNIFNGTNTTLYDIADKESSENNLLWNLGHIFYTVWVLTPPVLLTFLNFRLIYALVEARKCRRELTSNVGTEDAQNLEKERMNRTTRMLVVVLTLFLVAEVPNGVIVILAIILDEEYYTDCFIPLAKLVDFPVLIDSGINFVVYYAMSRQFRTTFKSIFGYQGYKRDNRISVTSTTSCTNQGFDSVSANVANRIES